MPSKKIQPLAPIIFSICCCAILPLARSQEAGPAKNIDRQVRSILSNKCFACHGPDENSREADLRLDTREGALESAINLDEPTDSELLARINSDDPDMIMPPPKHGEPLSDKDRELMKKWVADGATYTSHWSYLKPTKPQVPQVAASIDANEIDQFVQARLVGSGLRPAEPADRRVLIRRLALDLTGLPPTPEEVKRFINDSSENAYETLVDYYLSRPSYGERWAAMWLDLARYADSAGYADDRKRTIWAYRDYVIRSYNENKSFDLFTVEQLAGDLLEAPTEQQMVATAFHRNTLTNSEGGTSDEEFHSAAVVDRVNTTMAVWMGTTMACAQCHTHKYDPITQKEYFQFYDFFNQSADYDRPNESPVFKIYSTEVQQRRQAIKSELAANKAESKEIPTAAEVDAWIAEMKNEYRGKASSRVRGQFVRVDLPGKEKILSLAEVNVFSRVNGERVNVATRGTATQSSVAYDGPAGLAIDGNTDGDFEKKSTTHTNTEQNPWWQVDLGEVVPIESISIWHRLGNGIHSRSDGFRLSVLDVNKKEVWSRDFAKAVAAEQVAEVEDLPSVILELINQAEPLDDAGRSQLENYFQELEKRKIQIQISKLNAELASLKSMTTLPVMQALPEKQRRTSKVQIRGNYLDTGETVSAATPAIFHPLKTDAAKNRLGLAHWLVDQDNPLTARVVVNRYWEQIFGIGIVETSEEFGAQGELPSHPDLLDWLSADLVENRWDTHHLLKQIVMSKTYRQSSSASSQSLSVDPNNRLLSRGPRVRLTAEMIRDQALAVSGLLSSKMYGPPVQPPQPKVGLKPAFSGQTTNWTDSVGENRYRRGIYTEWRRSSPYPSMSTFDVNSREVCELRRTATNTPLQALVTLNDPVYVEAAQGLARRMVGETNAKTALEKAKFGFQLCLIRKPTEAESIRIRQLFEEAKRHFENDKTAAAALATDPLNPPKSGSDLVELAAWTTVANVLLNLDEMLMKP